MATNTYVPKENRTRVHIVASGFGADYQVRTDDGKVLSYVEKVDIEIRPEEPIRAHITVLKPIVQIDEAMAEIRELGIIMEKKAGNVSDSEDTDG